MKRRNAILILNWNPEGIHHLNSDAAIPNQKTSDPSNCSVAWDWSSTSWPVLSTVHHLHCWPSQWHHAAPVLPECQCASWNHPRRRCHYLQLLGIPALYDLIVSGFRENELLETPMEVVV